MFFSKRFYAILFENFKFLFFTKEEKRKELVEWKFL